MTVVAARRVDGAIDDSSPSGLRSWFRRERSWLAPSLVAVLNAVAFAIAAPNVNDIFAANAREYAVLHGVGLKYWFGWFGGGSTPGNYSVITPYLSAAVGAVLLAAVASAAITPVAWLVLRQTRHPVAAIWLATVTAGLNLWSGRVPFALGCLLAVAAVVAVTRRLVWPAGLLGILTVAASPVAGVFVLIGLAGVFLSRPDWRRMCLWAALPIGLTLIGAAVVFGQPGPESFTALQLAQLLAAAGVFLVAATANWVRTIVWLTIVAAPLVFLIPNGLGDNLLRLVAYCLPALIVATSGRRLRVALLGASLALVLSAKQSVGDVLDAAQQPASPKYYTTLIAELSRLQPQLRDCRLEMVDDGTHTAAYALLDHAMLARGYEYQEDNALNAVLATSNLSAVPYKIWLDNNAACYVAIASTHRRHTTPEYRLVAQRRPGYLVKVWQDPSWTLYRVAHPNRIVSRPVTVLQFSQSRLVLRVPCACTFGVRVRNPQNLKAVRVAPTGSTGPALKARLEPDLGWTTMTTPAPGVYVLSGSI